MLCIINFTLLTAIKNQSLQHIYIQFQFMNSKLPLGKECGPLRENCREFLDEPNGKPLKGSHVPIERSFQFELEVKNKTL